MKVMTKQLLAVIVLASTGVHFSTLSANAQFAYKDTVGNETENNAKYMFAVNEAKNFRTSIISNPNLRPLEALSGFASRHARQEGSTGIGGSTLQTTSVTTESAPALVRPSTLSIGNSTFERPNLFQKFGEAQTNPALSKFDVRLSGFDEDVPAARSPQSFTNTGSLIPNVFSGGSSADEFRFGD